MRSAIPSTRRAAPIGVRAAMLISVETWAIAPQKTDVTVGPAIALPGSTALDSRRLSWVTSGLSHCGFVFGPVGPLLKPDSRWPQRPSYVSH